MSGLGEFQEELLRDGFADTDEVTLKAGERRTPHDHPFHVRGLVLRGELNLFRNGAEETLRPGQTFDMAAGCEHYERGGPEGAVYFVGRRH